MTNAVSLFDGIGGFPLALSRCGIPTVATVEIDAACRGVTDRNLPPHKQLTDVREITGDDLIKIGFEPDTGILTAGWPCQGNSVAGRRGGMADPRSGLWRETARLLAETRPRWFLGENVPGLLTVNGGEDFWQVIRSLDELGYGVAWRVLDAQNFGVPQRRRRVLIVGCLGDGARPAEILLEPESGYGDSAPGPQAGTRVAGTLAASAGSGGLGGLGQSANAITSRIVETVSTLQGGGRRGYRIDAEGAAGGHVIPIAFSHIRSDPTASTDVFPTLTAGTDVTGGVAVAHTLTSGVATKPGVNPPGRRNEDDCNLVCVTGDATHTLTTANNGKNSSEDGTGRGVPIVTADPAYALSAHHGHDDRENNYVIKPRLGVRRLTPRECERLQGFPDDWTAGQSDSARYRQLGNAVAVPVIEWVARRTLEVESTSNH